MRKIRVGHIGLGRLGRQHAYNLRFRLQDAELAALCDIDEKALQKCKEEWGIEKNIYGLCRDGKG